MDFYFSSYSSAYGQSEIRVWFRLHTGGGTSSIAFLWSWSSVSCYSCSFRSCCASRSFSSFRAYILPRVPSRSCCYYILSCSKESSPSPQPFWKCKPHNTPLPPNAITQRRRRSRHCFQTDSLPAHSGQEGYGCCYTC